MSRIVWPTIHKYAGLRSENAKSFEREQLGRTRQSNSAEQLGRAGGGRAGAQNFILKACVMPCYNEVSHLEETVGRSIKVRQERIG